MGSHAATYSRHQSRKKKTTVYVLRAQIVQKSILGGDWGWLTIAVNAENANEWVLEATTGFAAAALWASDEGQIETCQRESHAFF